MVIGLSQLPFPSTVLVQALNFWTAGNPVHGIDNCECCSAKRLSAIRAKCLSFVFLFLYLKKSPVAIHTCRILTWQSYWLHHYGFAENNKARSISNHHEYYIFIITASWGRHHVEISFFAIQSNHSVLNRHPYKAANILVRVFHFCLLFYHF